MIKKKTEKPNRKTWCNLFITQWPINRNEVEWCVSVCRILGYVVYALLPLEFWFFSTISVFKTWEYFSSMNCIIFWREHVNFLSRLKNRIVCILNFCFVSMFCVFFIVELIMSRWWWMTGSTERKKWWQSRCWIPNEGKSHHQKVF